MIGKVCRFSGRFLKRCFEVFSVPRMCRETKGTATPIRFRMWFLQRILGCNAGAYWPVSHLSTVTDAARVKVGIGAYPGFSPGIYIQARNGVIFGDYTLVGPNVGIISANHSIYDVSEHVSADPINIGAYSWIGMNSVILPGVHLGPHTIVAANSVVRHSFPDGCCILAGSPATVIL